MALAPSVELHPFTTDGTEWLLDGVGPSSHVLANSNQALDGGIHTLNAASTNVALHQLNETDRTFVTRVTYPTANNIEAPAAMTEAEAGSGVAITVDHTGLMASYNGGGHPMLLLFDNYASGLGPVYSEGTATTVTLVVRSYTSNYGEGDTTGFNWTGVTTTNGAEGNGVSSLTHALSTATVTNDTLTLTMTIDAGIPPGPVVMLISNGGLPYSVNMQLSAAETPFGMVGMATVPTGSADSLLCLGAATKVPRPVGPPDRLCNLPWRTEVLMVAPAGSPCGPFGSPLRQPAAAWVDAVLLTGVSGSAHGTTALARDGDEEPLLLTGGHAVLLPQAQAAAALPAAARHRALKGDTRTVGPAWPGAEWLLACDLQTVPTAVVHARGGVHRWVHVAPLNRWWRYHGALVLAGTDGLLVEPCRSHPLRLLQLHEGVRAAAETLGMQVRSGMVVQGTTAPTSAARMEEALAASPPAPPRVVAPEEWPAGTAPMAALPGWPRVVADAVDAAGEAEVAAEPAAAARAGTKQGHASREPELVTASA